MMIQTNYYPELFPALNVAEIDVVEDAAGPGRRLVLWLQGCLKRCPGCANATFLAPRNQRILSVQEICAMLDSLPDLDGITLSGGEPILQAEAAHPLLLEVRRRGLNVVSYTGYTLEELQEEVNLARTAPFLRYVDLLIDGEYRQELLAEGAYRPSANQRCHYLSGRIQAGNFDKRPGTVFVLAGERATATGVLPMAVRHDIFERLKALGVTISATSPPGVRDQLSSDAASTQNLPENA